MPCLLCLMMCFHDCGPQKPPRPRPLPKKRIDIRRRRPIAQFQSCHLLRLPPELRQKIWTLALGGYTIALRPTHGKRSSIQSSSSALEDFPGEMELLFSSKASTTLAQRIPVALLRTCRQIYQEGQPTLHQCNTFYFMVEEFPAVLLAGLGRYSLPDIRRIHIVDISGYYSPAAPSWEVAFPLLRTMRLDHLACVSFSSERLDEHRLAGMDDVFSRELLTIRNLRSLDIQWFGPVEASPQQETRDNLQRAFRELMIGPDADTRYEARLQQKAVPPPEI
ncbi:hypothetical protein C8R43DRAFT_1178993 [Mycena crocata]|nr:hypothetical protein C8R43DRAFT_1178993 [Mycena crocata]